MEVYKITNSINGKIYIGSTKNCKEERFWNPDYGHWRMARSGRQGQLYDDLRKYGPYFFALETLEELNDETILVTREGYFIEKYWDTYGEEMMYNNQRGISSFYKGFIPTEEHKKRMSEAHLGVPLSENHKRNKRNKYYLDDKEFIGFEELLPYLNSIGIHVTADIIRNLTNHNYISKYNKEHYPKLLDIQVKSIQKNKVCS